MFNEDLINFQLMLKAGYKSKSAAPGATQDKKEKYAGFIDLIDRTVEVLKAAVYSPQSVREAADREDDEDIYSPLGHLDKYLFKVCRVVNTKGYRPEIDGQTDYICIGNSCTCTEQGVIDYLQLTERWLDKASFLVKLKDVEVIGDYDFE